MREQELLQQFIMIGSTERGGLDSTAHQYYNMQVLHIKAFLCCCCIQTENLNYFTFSAKRAEFFQQNPCVDSLESLLSYT